MAADIVELTGVNQVYGSITTLTKIARGAVGTDLVFGYTVRGNSVDLSQSQTLQNTRIFQQNIDGPYAPGTVKNLTLSYTAGGAASGNALVSVENAGTRTFVFDNVKFTGVHNGWNGNGNLYMSMRSYDSTAPMNVSLTLNKVQVDITGQNNSFNGTTGGSAFLHSWNNNGAVTLTDCTFDEAGFASSLNLLTFGATAAGNYTISNSIFKRTSNQTVRPEGIRLGSVVASLTGNTFQDGSYLDLYGNVGSVTLTSNTFGTIAGGYGIRVNDPVSAPISGVLTVSGTNVFSGGGLALKYVKATAGSTSLLATSSDSFTVNGVTGFKNLFAGGQAADTITGNSTSNWISGDTGNDSLTGGAGDDAFVFATALDASTNLDTITDFKASGAGTDKIWLARSVFTGLTAGTSLDASDFGTVPAFGADVVYDSSSKGLFFNAGGAANLSGYTQFATLGGTSTTSVVNGDFVLF